MELLDAEGDDDVEQQMFDAVHAVGDNDLERVRLLVEQGYDKDMMIGDYTPLYVAIKSGSFKVAQYLVEQGATLDKANSKGHTPLVAAVRTGQLEATRYLLEQGADRDKANNGCTPLHHAAMNGHLEIAMLLMSYGADLNARTNEGYLSIDCANTEIRQAIRDEPRRRMDHGHKRATEQDRHPNAATSASAQQEEGEGEEKEEEQSNKKPRMEEESAVAEEETKVAEEDEDSEPSDDEDDN